MKKRVPLLISALSLVFPGCVADYSTGKVCTAIAVPALAVTVLDGVTGQRICDATVVAVEGSFRSPLERSPGEMCGYSGPYERAGVYEVQVSREGYRAVAESNVRVNADECHVITRQLTVTLVR